MVGRHVIAACHCPSTLETSDKKPASCSSLVGGCLHFVVGQTPVSVLMSSSLADMSAFGDWDFVADGIVCLPTLGVFFGRGKRGQVLPL